MKIQRLAVLAGTAAALAQAALAAVTVTLDRPGTVLEAGELFIFNATVDGAKQDARCTWALVEYRDLGKGGAFEAPARDARLTFMDGQGNIRPAGMAAHARVFFSTTGSGGFYDRTFQLRATSVEDLDASATVTFRVRPGRVESKEAAPGSGAAREALPVQVWETPFTAAFHQAGGYQQRCYDASAPAPTLAAVEARRGQPVRLAWLGFAGKEPAAAVTLPEGASPFSQVATMPDGSAVVTLEAPVRLCRVSPAGKVGLIGKDGVPWSPGEGKGKTKDGAGHPGAQILSLAAAPDGGLVVAAAGGIHRVAPDGTATVLAGGGAGGTGQDLSRPGRPALQMDLSGAEVIVSRNGDIRFLVRERGVYALPADGVARLVWPDATLSHGLLETDDGRLVASDGVNLLQAGAGGESLLLCSGTTHNPNNFTKPIPPVALTPSSDRQVGFLAFPIAVPGGGLLVQERWTRRMLYLGPPAGDEALVKRVQAATAAVEQRDFALAARLRDDLRREAGIGADPQVLKRVSKGAGLAGLPAPLVRKIMASFEIPKGDKVRARIASHVLDLQIEALPEATRAAFRTWLDDRAKVGSRGETKTEAKPGTRTESKAGTRTS